MDQATADAPSRPMGLRARLRNRVQSVSTQTYVLVALMLTVAVMVLLPIGALLYGSFSSAPMGRIGSLTLEHYREAFAYSGFVELTRNTLVFAVGQTALAMGLGTALAFVVTRTNTPFRRTFSFLTIYLFLMPPILGAVAWRLLLSPRTGLLNVLTMRVFGLTEPPFDIFSMWGMIWVQGLFLTPFVFLIVSAAFSSMDASYEESARMSGSGLYGTLRRVSLPLARPALLSAGLLMMVVGLESFDVPALLGGIRGIHVYTSLIFRFFDVFPPRHGLATALATVLLAATVIGVLLYRRATRNASRFVTVGGRGRRVATIDLGRWRYLVAALCFVFFFVAVVLPMLILVFGSLLRFYGRFDSTIFSRMTLDNYRRLIDFPSVGRSFRNSLVLATVGATICTFMAVLVGYITNKTRMRGRGWLDSLTMMPLGFPAPVFAVGLLWAYIMFPIGIVGTLWILGLAYVSRYLPIGVRSVSGPLIQIDSDMEAASRISGATWWMTFRGIILPLLKSGFLSAWLLLFMIFLRELSASVLLAGPGTETISTILFGFYVTGDSGPMSALAVVLVVLITVVIVVARRVFRVNLAL